MTWAAFVVVGALVALSQLLRIIWKHGSFERWMTETPMIEIFNARATIMFGGALILCGLVFAR